MSITRYFLGRTFHDVLGLLIPFLKSSPNLVSLSFACGDPNRDLAYSPVDLVASLGENFTFPHLRIFRLHGCIDPNWPAFLERQSLEADPLRRFFARHPRIEVLAFNSDFESLPHDIDPSYLLRIFPCLKSFEGSSPLLVSVLLTFSEQLENIVITDGIADDTLKKLYYGIPTLPKLRRLAILGFSGNGILTRLFRALVKAARELEEIEFRPLANYNGSSSLTVPSCDYVRVFQSLCFF